MLPPIRLSTGKKVEAPTYNCPLECGCQIYSEYCLSGLLPAERKELFDKLKKRKHEPEGTVHVIYG